VDVIARGGALDAALPARAGCAVRGQAWIFDTCSNAAFSRAVPHFPLTRRRKVDLFFAEGLAEERSRAIRVCALCPDPTVSEFHAVADQGGFTRTNQGAGGQVGAGLALRALAAGRSTSSRVGQLSRRTFVAAGAPPPGDALAANMFSSAKSPLTPSAH